MSLLVFSSSSKIAQGIIRQLYASGKYEKIVCADLYPNYWSIRRHLQFVQELESVKSPTKLTDTKISEKSDLATAISNATDLVYITHDYYQNVPTKENLLKQSSRIAAEKKHLKRFITVLPMELDNWAEAHPLDVTTQSAETALQTYDKQVILRTDLIFGFGSVLFPTILSRIINHQSVSFSPSSLNPQPICCCGVQGMVSALLDSTTEGTKYLAQGTEKVSWNTIFKELQRLSYTNPKTETWEKVISPFSQNVLSELLYDRNYQNAVQMIKKYHQPPHIDYETPASLGVELQSFSTWVQKADFPQERVKTKEGSLEQMVMNRLY